MKVLKKVSVIILEDHNIYYPSLFLLTGFNSEE